jgi:hypothetical protein
MERRREAINCVPGVQEQHDQLQDISHQEVVISFGGFYLRFPSHFFLSQKHSLVFMMLFYLEYLLLLLLLLLLFMCYLALLLLLLYVIVMT